MKLLHKTIRSYILYSIFILLVAIPSFYFVIQNILRSEIDEELLDTKNLIRPKIIKALHEHSLSKLDFADGGLTVQQIATSDVSDSIFTKNIYVVAESEILPYRIIQSTFIVEGQGILLRRQISLTENDDLLKSILLVDIIMLVLLLAGLFFINRRQSKKLWQPFYETLAILKKYSVEKHASLLLPSSNISEFSDLHDSLDELTERTHKTFVSQKEFTENASHEMQTPLAIFQSKLELLMQTAPLSEEQAGLIDELGDAGQRMTRLNKGLILLTRIDNRQFHTIDNISVKENIDLFIKQYELQINEKAIQLHVFFEEDVILQCNKTLLEILISNLIGNAIRHNITGGVIEIVLKKNDLIIKNSGIQNELDKNKIFSRFHKNSDDEYSLGLGLEIATRIAKILDYNISYAYENHMHQFTVQFK